MRQLTSEFFWLTSSLVLGFIEQRPCHLEFIERVILDLEVNNLKYLMKEDSVLNLSSGSLEN